MPENTSLTDWGRRIWQACPPPDAPGISERTLIEKLHGLAAYADYQRGIAELVEGGYLIRDHQTYRRSTLEP